MFETLSNYLEMRSTPEQKTVLLSACRALVDAGYTDHAGVLEQELSLADAPEQDLYYSIVNQYMIPLYNERLNEYGIVLQPDADLPILTSIFTALQCVDNWSDPWGLLDAAKDIEGPEAALADLLAITGGHTTEDYLAVLDSVSPDLIERVQEILTAQANNDPDLEPDSVIEGRQMCEQRIEALNAVISPDYSLLVRSYADGLGRLYIPARYILNQYYKSLREMTDKQRAGAEVLMLLAASTLQTRDLRTSTMSLVEQLNFEPTELTAVDQSIVAYLQKARLYENNN